MAPSARHELAAAAAVSTSVSGLSGNEVLGEGGACELLAHQASEEQHRAARPVVHHYVLGLPGSVAADRDDNAGGLAADLTGVVLEEAVIAVIAGEAELLVLIQLAGGDHDRTDGLRALRDPLHRRALPGDVVGQVVQPPRVIGASQICHAVPPPESGSWPDALCSTPPGSRLVLGYGVSYVTFDG